MSEHNKVTCPECGCEFNIESVLSAKIQAEYEKKLQEEKTQLEADTKQRIESKLAEEKKKLEEQAAAQANKSVEDKLKYYEEEQEKKNKQLQELKAKEIGFLKKEQAIKEKEAELQLQLEKQMLEKTQEIEAKILKQAEEKFSLEKRELEKKVEDNRKLAEEMQRKANQGSMQLQGEVQELALEELLIREYPFDEISEVSKGVKGADCIQLVKNSHGVACGKIVYESKRTKTFGNDWIDKLKSDLIACKGDIAVLVTEAMPKDKTQFFEEKGVWVCQFQEVKPLSLILREMLIRVQAMKNSQENKGDKMELLYNYLSSAEFVNKVKSLVDAFQKMRDSLDKERKAMTKLWEERDKQLWSSQEALIGIFGSINGISDNLLGNDGFLSLE